MTPDRQKQLADAFRRAHRGPLLLLPNAWDAMSARQFEAAGFGAVATTSGGLAWDLGYADGEKAPWREVVAAHERIVRAVRVPVTADIEAGYGDTPAQVGEEHRRDPATPAWSASIWRTARRAPICRSGRSRTPSRASAPRGRPRTRPACRRSSTPGSISTSRTSAMPASRLRRDGAARQGLSRGRRGLHLSVRPHRHGHHRPAGQGARQRADQYRGARRHAAGRRTREASALPASASPRAPRSR